MDTQINQLTITDAAKRFNVSRATLLRRAKSGAIKRNKDGTFDSDVLKNAGYMQRDSNVSDAPHEAREASQGTLQAEVLKSVIDALQKQLETSQNEKAQLLKQLDQSQQLILNAQQSIKLLAAAQLQGPEQQNIELLAEVRSQEIEQQEFEHREPEAEVEPEVQPEAEPQPAVSELPPTPTLPAQSPLPGLAEKVRSWLLGS